MENTERTCLECGKPLRGRVDKKFCDDYCRNAYNNKQNSDQNNLVRNINNILRRNRRILENTIPINEGLVTCQRSKLTNQSFNFKYYTHQLANKKGDVYFFCYEYGYLPLEGDRVLVVKQKDEDSH